MTVLSDTKQRELVDRTARALADRSLEANDLKRVLDRAARERQLDAGGAIRAFGLLIAYAGVVFAYVINYDSLSLQAQKYTPFIFPAVLLVAAIALDRLARPAWEPELAATIGDVALAITFLVLGHTWGWTRAYGEAAAAISLTVSVGMYFALRMVRLSTWAAAASVIALTACWFADSSVRSVAHLFLLEAVAGAILGVALFRRIRPVATQALYLATLLGLLACLFGVIADSEPFFDNPKPGVSIWALGLFLTTLLALAGAATFELTGLIWLGTLGGLLTLGAVVAPVRGDPHWAHMMVLIGIVLAVGGWVVHQARREPPSRPM